MKFSAKPLTLTLVLLSLFASASLAQDFASQRLNNWHQWRGPLANGFAPNARPPVEWSETKNVKWKVTIPGEGIATPIVWGDRIFILMASPVADGEAATPALRVNQPALMAQQRPPSNGAANGAQRGGQPGSGAAPTMFKFDILCLDRGSGQTIWQKTARQVVPHEGHHPTSTFASASPVTDGQHVWVSFGSRGIFCYDLAGNEQWHKDLGQMKTRNAFGEGASPALYNDTLVVPWDHEGDSFIVAMNAATGQEKWRKPRDESTTWATPLIVPHAGRVQVITNGQNRVRSYDLANGDLIWECGGQGPNPIPSPVLVDDSVVVMTGFQRFAAYSIPLDSKGDITDTDKPTWKINDGTPYVASPLLYDDLLYFTKDRGNLLTSLDARSGDILIDRKRLPDISSIYASPVGAAGRVYISSREGKTIVLEQGRDKELKVIRTNELAGDSIDASPALVGNEMFLRSGNHLYCITEM